MPDSNAALALQEFGLKIGLPQITFDKDQRCSLSFDDIIVNLELSANAKSLSATLWIAEIAPEQRAEVALALAGANFLFSGTHGATLGMNRNTGDLALAAQLADATINLAVFEEAIENLVNLADAWQKRLADNPSPDSEDTPPSAPEDLNRFIRA